MLQLFLDDWNLTLCDAARVLRQEPAVALEHGGELRFGAAAIDEARLHPRGSNQDYLGKLNADPLNQPMKAARNHADLTYLHLKALTEEIEEVQDGVCVIVPSTVSNDQLGLFLGVAKEAGLPIKGFTDLAALSGAALPTPQHFQFIELNLGRAYLCEVRSNPLTRVETPTEFIDFGISRVLDGWTNVIADQFVTASRFDPLHAADTEQQLYNLVRGWMGSEAPSSYVTLEHQNQTRRQEISIDALRAKLEQMIEPLQNLLNPELPIRLGPNASALPLLRSVLSANVDVHRSSIDELRRYLAMHAGSLFAGDAVELIDELEPLPEAMPVGAEPPVIEKAPEARPGPVHVPGSPTHGLHATVAYPIGSEALPLSVTAEQAIGTTIEHDGRLFTLIEVLEE